MHRSCTSLLTNDSSTYRRARVAFWSRLKSAKIIFVTTRSRQTSRRRSKKTVEVSEAILIFHFNLSSYVTQTICTLTVIKNKKVSSCVMETKKNSWQITTVKNYIISRTFWLRLNPEISVQRFDSPRVRCRVIRVENGMSRGVELQGDKIKAFLLKGITHVLPVYQRFSSEWFQIHELLH